MFKANTNQTMNTFIQIFIARDKKSQLKVRNITRKFNSLILLAKEVL